VDNLAGVAYTQADCKRFSGADCWSCTG